jgi:hypothetical protein
VGKVRPSEVPSVPAMSVFKSNGSACETKPSQRRFMKTTIKKRVTKLLFDIDVDNIPKLIG